MGARQLGRRESRAHAVLVAARRRAPRCSRRGRRGRAARSARFGGLRSVAAIAIAIDAAWPTTADRKARQRAVHDLRELQHTLKLKWDKVRLAYPDPQTPKRIAHALALLDAVQAKREEIGKYLGNPRPGMQLTPKS